MSKFVADFETTTDEKNCHVWAFAICEIGNKDNVILGTTIDDFINWCENRKENDLIYFHNLKFDGQFIMYYLFNHGYTHTIRPEDKKSKTFNTSISDKGLFYYIEVIFKKNGKHINKVVFQDSLKLIPLSVDSIAKSFKLPIQKLNIDYSLHNELPIGSPLSNEEEEYIKHDVQIVAYAIEYFYSQGLNKMTIGSCALNEYKMIISKRNFKLYYPVPKYHKDVKQSYKGGFTYLNPIYSEKIVNKGIVLDVNSLYPSVMYDEYLPFGTPIYFKGKYKKDPIYTLYTQMLRCQFEIKPGKLPTIQIKYGYGFKGNEYLTTSGDTEVVLCLNSVDLELFFEHYDVYNVEYISGWKFKGAKGLFTDYIDKWSNNKIQAKKDGNHGLYLISKLFLNSLYGKFGTDTKVKNKIPYLGEDNQIHYKDSEEEEREGIYVAMASFITSYARRKTIKTSQAIKDYTIKKYNKDCYVYSDTDSIHTIIPKGLTFNEYVEELKQFCDISPTILGYWKYESKFNKAKFLRQKCYIENSTEDIENDNPDYELKVTVAGMPKACHEYVNFDNFKIGATYKGKMQPKIVPGGVVLSDIDFTIKEL